MESVAGDLDWDLDDLLAWEGQEQKKILDGNLIGTPSKTT